MKKQLLAVLLILPGFFANAAPEFRSLTDLGVCTDGTKTARFLDGDRLRTEQFVHNDVVERTCFEIQEKSNSVVKFYSCATYSWEFRDTKEGDLNVIVNLRSSRASVQLLDVNENVLMGAYCVPHGG